VSDFDFEPVPGLPEHLPAGEAMLWQGSPDWRTLACEAFHVRKLAIYFGLLLAWSIAAALYDGRPEQARSAVIWLGAFFVASASLLVGLAWAIARTTIYTITTHRIVMRCGVALPITFNLPFRVIAGVALKENSDRTGDIPLTISGPDRIAWLVMWPHVRPWHVSQPEPMLRAIPDAAQVALVLGRALRAAQPVQYDIARSPVARKPVHEPVHSMPADASPT
jgi:Bacterial PH domain